MDKNNPADASVDFDRDGLSALKEYQLESISGVGEGPLGKWKVELLNLDFMNRVGLTHHRKTIIDLNDQGDLLVSSSSWTPSNWASSYRRDWFFDSNQESWEELFKVGGQEADFITASDMNNHGVVVGRARGGQLNNGETFGFLKDMRASGAPSEVSPWLNEQNEMVASLTGINDFGEVIGLDESEEAFFEGLAGTLRGPSSWEEPEFTAVNNWGEIVGIDHTDYWGVGAGRHFLIQSYSVGSNNATWNWLQDFPAFDMNLVDPEYDDVYGPSFKPAWLNNWGEFGGTYNMELDSEMVGTWFFDGFAHEGSLLGSDGLVKYRDLLGNDYSYQIMRGLNDWPQILVSGNTDEEGEGDDVMFLLNGAQRVPLTAFAPATTGVNWTSARPVAINNAGTIAGLHGSTLFLLSLDQDADGDGMSNDWELYLGLDPDNPDDAFDYEDTNANGELDQNERYYIEQYLRGWLPEAPAAYRVALDTDADGLPDAWERRYWGSLSAVNNANGDHDNDGLTNHEEWYYGTNPKEKDTDGDTIWDSVEVFFAGTQPVRKDSDGDGAPDGWELDHNTNPRDEDSLPTVPLFIITATELDFEGSPYHVQNVGDVAGQASVFFSNALANQIPELSEANNSPNAPDSRPTVQTQLQLAYGLDYEVTVPVLKVTNSDSNTTLTTDEFVIPTGGDLRSNIIVTEVPDGSSGIEYLLPVEVRDVNGEGDADDVTISPWDESQQIADHNIALIDAHAADDDPNPRMPQLEFRINGLVEALTIEAKLEVKYDRGNGARTARNQAEDRVRIPADGSFKQVDGDNWVIHGEADWQNELTGKGFFGGDAKLTYQIKKGAEVVLAPQEIDFRIGGENPDDAKCRTYIESQPNAGPGDQLWFAYAIAKSESADYNGQGSRYNQFLELPSAPADTNYLTRRRRDAGRPLWGDDGGASPGGYGMFQVTGTATNQLANIPRKEIWNWQENAKAGLVIIESKRVTAYADMATQRQQANKPLPSHTVQGVTFEEGTTRVMEAAQTMKLFNGASRSLFSAPDNGNVNGFILDSHSSGNYCYWRTHARRKNSAKPNENNPNVGHGTVENVPDDWGLSRLNILNFNYVDRVCQEVED